MELINILLVEDNPDHAMLTRRVLEDNGVANRVFVVENGADALDFVYGRGEYGNGNGCAPRPGLILLDVKLPKISGFEVLKKLKNDPKHSSIPIVMLTTSAHDEEIARGYADGANSYVVKPVKFDEFSEKVKNVGLYCGLVSSRP